MGKPHKTKPIRIKDQASNASATSLDVSLSSSDLDEKKGLVWATCDKVVTTGLVDFVSRVLESQGFAINLENTLACLESVEFSHVTTDEGTYNHGVSFFLPKKTRHGSLIKQLYSELESYGDKKNASESLKKKVEKLTRDIAKLSATNEKSEEKLQELKAKISIHSGSNQSDSANQKDSTSGDIRFCTLDNLNYEKRLMDIKMNRKRLTIGMNWLASSGKIPKEGQGCIAVFHKEKVHGLIVLPTTASSSSPVESMAATVLYSNQDQIRIRDEQRRLITLRAHSIAEKETFKALKRGDFVKLSHVGGNILWLEAIKNQSQIKYKDFIQKKLIERSIEENQELIAEKKHA